MTQQTISNPAGTAASGDIYVSVVIPAKNEADNLPSLLGEVRAALADEAYEVIVVDDGSTDSTAAALLALKREGFDQLRILSHTHSLGQSTSIYHAAQVARGQWLATLDGDGQNDPADIPRMLARAEAESAATGGWVMVAGHRVNRKDSWVKRRSSRLANGIRASLLKDATPDTGCGLKLFPRALFQAMPHFDHMHRFLPALALRAGAVVRSEPVNHRPRLRGASNYGTLDRLMVGIVDLFGVMWLIRRASPRIRIDEDA